MMLNYKYLEIYAFRANMHAGFSFPINILAKHRGRLARLAMFTFTEFSNAEGLHSDGGRAARW
jgi:hypothetical protein